MQAQNIFCCLMKFMWNRELLFSSRRSGYPSPDMMWQAGALRNITKGNGISRGAVFAVINFAQAEYLRLQWKTNPFLKKDGVKAAL